MRFLNLTVLSLVAVGLANCAYPVSSSVQGSASSVIYFTNVAVGTQVLIDGAPSGDAINFDGTKAVLVVPTGTHRVVLQRDGVVVHQSSVFVGSGSKVAIKGPEQ